MKAEQDDKPKIKVGGSMCDSSDSEEEEPGGSQRKSLHMLDMLDMPEMHKPRMKKKTV